MSLSSINTLARLLVGSLLLCTLASAFSFQAVGKQRVTALHATNHANEQTRSSFLISTATTLSSILFTPNPSHAASITGCPLDSKTCISTLNVKNIDSYSPPWTFEVSPDEAFARIKGVLTSDDSYRLTEVDAEARYVKAHILRPFPDKGLDEVEILVKSDDKVVVFRVSEKGEAGITSDSAANRRRMDSIRKKGAVFGLMGEGLTADSYDGGGAVSRGNNPFGQLKAFYGLQSGEGFESVFEEDD